MSERTGINHIFATNAGAAFDFIAAKYDDEFTNSMIGRAQRDSVWKVLLEAFQTGDHVLELNCGTGEDALFLASRGVSVLACDASEQMIRQAEERLPEMQLAPSVTFCHLATERIAELDPSKRFDGAFSNFSGLNCVEHLPSVSLNLSRMLKRGGALVLCLSTRFCISEILFYLLRGDRRKAFRRCEGRATAALGGANLIVYYPALQQIIESFAPDFRLCSLKGVGVAIPPSYLEPWVRRHATIFGLLCYLEGLLAYLPILRSTADHVLLRFEKVSQ